MTGMVQQGDRHCHPGRALKAARRGIVVSVLFCGLLATLVGRARAEVATQSSGSEQVGRADLEERARAYERLLKANPDSAELWSNLGAVRAMLGDCPSSLKALDRARTLNPRLFVPWYFSGYCRLALYQDESALRLLEQATRLNPRDSNAWLLRAQAASNVGQMAASLVAAVRSLELDPGRPEGYYLAGKAALSLAALAYGQMKAEGPAAAYFYCLGGERSASQGAWDAAIESYRKASAAAPDDSDVIFGLGSVHLESGRYAEAEEALRRCVQLAPDSAWARLRLALALALESKRDEAARMWTRITPQDVPFAPEWIDYIALAYLLGNQDQAGQALRHAREQFPEQFVQNRWLQALASNGGTGPAASRLKPEGLAEVGLAVRFMLTREGAAAPARRWFPSAAAYSGFREAFLNNAMVEAARQLAPALAAPLSDARRCFFLGETLQSISLGLLQHLASSFPDSEPAMLLAAENYRSNHESAKALEIYQAVLQRHGRSPAVLRDVAETYWENHDWDHALGVLQELAASAAADPRVFVNMGRIYLTEQRTGEAEQAFRRALEIQPGMAEAHFGLGEVRRRRGDYRAALEQLQTAARLDPADPGTRYALAQVYQKLGKSGLAEQEMAAFQRLRARAGAENSSRRLVPVDGRY